MYADDLLLLAQSVLGMQKLIDVCMSEFMDLLDMQINDKKSSCIKVGPRYQNHSAALTVNELVLTCSLSLKYLGHVLLSGRTFKCDNHPIRTKFFGALNSILSKIGTKTELNVSLSLLAKKCVPILMYSFESFNLTNKKITSFSNIYNSIFFKLFKTFNKEIIQQCQFYSGYLPFRCIYHHRCLNFLDKMNQTSLSSSNFLFYYNDRSALECLCTEYHIHPSKSKSQTTNQM